MGSNPNQSKDKRVYFLSEVAYDAYFFNEHAYENLIKFMERDPDDLMIVIDGALTRIDRPEILNSLLSYWEKTEQECYEAGESIPNFEQCQHMLDIQFEILKKHLADLCKRLPEAKLVLYIATDDTQYTVSRSLHELLIARRAQISLEIKTLTKEKRESATEGKEFKLQLDQLQGKNVGNQRRRTQSQIDKQLRDLKKVEEKIVAKKEELNLYREQKIRAKHQHVTVTFVKHLCQRYEELCKEFKVKLVDRPKVLKHGNFVFEYAHSRHKTWAPVRHRDEALRRSKVEDNIRYGRLINNVTVRAEEKKAEAHVESGHHGVGFETLQKVQNHPDETNFKGQSSYDPTIAPQKDHVKICMALPFEDQERIGRFVSDGEQERMSLGKPTGTRSHEVFRRFSNDSVSGLFMLTKSAEDGLLTSRFIQYQNFKDGSVLKQPERYWAAWASSDEHLCSPEENPMARDGLFSLYQEHAAKPFKFQGKPVSLAGFISGGDTGEATLVRWDRRYDDRPDPQELLEENIRLLVELKTDSVEDVLALALKMTSDTMSGVTNSMRVVLERVLTYYLRFLDVTLPVNRHRYPHVSTTGNHADGVLRSIGLRESDFFVQHAKAKGIRVFEVGISDRKKTDSLPGACIAIGGYSDARIIHLEDYGLDVTGKTLFGPISFLLQHDPNGPGTSGLVGAGQKAGADVSTAGHTHENWTKLFRTGLNQFRVAYRFSTLTGVTPTEIVYASSVPRTQAAHRIIMPTPGDFIETTMTAAYLREVGIKYHVKNVKAAMEKNKKGRGSK